MDNREQHKKYDVFISYSREDDLDSPFIERLRNDLTRAGKSVYWDKANMQSRGRSFHVELRDAIWFSERLIAVVTPRALKSKYVLQEWSYAYHFSKAIVPLLRQGTYEDIAGDDTTILWRDEFEQLPGSLDISKIRSFHCPDFTNDKLYHKSFDELLRVLNDKLIHLANISGNPPAFPPANFLPRRAVLNKLTALHLVDPKDPRSFLRVMRIMVIHGPGGSGKSVLVNAIVHSFQARSAFVDGIIWLGIGKPQVYADTGYERPHVLRALSTLATSLGQDIEHYQDLFIAKKLANLLLTKKRCLIILDDVYDSRDVKDFIDILGPACAMYITTRSKGIAAELGIPSNEVVSLGDEDLVFNPEEARQLLADWSGLRYEQLPPEAEQVINICNGLPLSLAICGAIVRKNFPWSRLPQALLVAKEQIVETKLPEYSEDVVTVFTPVKVSLDYMKSLDKEEIQAGREPLRRFDQYVDLSVLHGGVRTPEEIICALWFALRNTDKDSAFRLLGELDSWSLLRLVGDALPNMDVLLHELQKAYIKGITSESQLTALQRIFGKVLFQTWQSVSPEEQQDDETENPRYEPAYYRRYLLRDLIVGKCWDETSQLLESPSYLESRHDKAEQFALENEIAGLIHSTETPAAHILAGAWRGITRHFPLGRKQADWLDTFAYWLNRYGKRDGEWISQDLKRIAILFDHSCGEISQQLTQKYLQQNKPDWALRFAELSVWAFQRNEDLEACAHACIIAERICSLEQLEKGYQLLGKIEFMRMRSKALTNLAAREHNPDKKAAITTQADELYNTLSLDFSKICVQHWLLSKRDWQNLEIDTISAFNLVRRNRTVTAHRIKILVVSNEHDAVSAIYLVQFLQARGAFIDWIHHVEFENYPNFTQDYVMGILIGGPKSPGISGLADAFLDSDRDNYLRMYSGLYLEPNQLKAEIDGTPCFMLGGISKVHTLLAVYRFTQQTELATLLG